MSQNDKEHKASESKLNKLHGVVADVITEQLQQREAKTEFNEEGECVDTGETVLTASPALIAAATKFLKDNSITCDIEQNENMTNLRDVLAKKQRHSRLGDAKTEAKVVDMYK